MTKITINSFCKKAFQKFVEAGLTKEGAAGLCGNIYSESAGFFANRVEFLCLQRLRENGVRDRNGKDYTDKTYTEEVNSGRITKAQFLNPLPNKRYGFGMVQWTSIDRKKGLYECTVEKGKSIADEDTQIEYCLYELKNIYKSVWSTLTTTTSIKTASDKILKDFEFPNNWQSLSATRYDYSKQIYDTLKNTATTSTSQTTGGTSVMGNYDKYINSTGTHYISNCGHDERGAYSGGQAGDQTGTEWQLIPWYSRPWNCVLRHPDPQVRKLHAEMSSAAALNDNIGYDQYQRDTFGVQLKAVGDDPSKIQVKCETDCSKGIIDITKAIGRKLNRPELQNINATYTGNMRSGYKAAGYQVLTESKYLAGTSYLLSGDILLNDASHTATNITNGSKANSSNTSSTLSSASSTTLQKGSTGSAVKTLQTNLNKLINAGLVVDGDFGTLTYNAVIKFQKKYKLTADGIVGNITQGKIDELLKLSTTSSSTTTSSSNKLNETPKWTGKVTADSLNVRTWAGTEYSTCSFSPLKYGTKVGVCDSVKSKDGSVWYFIKYNGKLGFVHSDYIAKI